MDEKGVDVVAECTGIFTTLETAQYHIDGGAQNYISPQGCLCML